VINLDIPIGQKIWDTIWSYWEQLEEHSNRNNWKLVRIRLEHNGNTPHPKKSQFQRKKLGPHKDMLNKFLFLKLFITIFGLS